MKKLSPSNIILIGFILVILVGSLLLLLPITHKDGINFSYIDSLFTSTSAVCVTGLLVADTADTFNFLGQFIILVLIQIGGLGITSIGVGLIALTGKKISIRGTRLAKEALNRDSFKDVFDLIKRVLQLTFLIETIGVILSFIRFIQDYSFFKALWISIFHSIASFNNAGFDILGGGTSLINYQNDIYLNIVTMLLIIFGGLGFFVIIELFSKRNIKKYSLHTKIVLTMTIILIFGGALLLKISQSNISWLNALFLSTTTRTAGFTTYNLATFKQATLFIMIILMFIGASPGSTGGGIKTTTFFIMIKSLYATAINKEPGAFKRTFNKELVYKAFLIFFLSIGLLSISTFLLCAFEPNIGLLNILFESTSALATVGLTTGITPFVCTSSKLVLCFTMLVGRVGPLTIVSIWYFKRRKEVTYVEESISIG